MKILSLLEAKYHSSSMDDALKFQQLCIENPYIEGVDAQLETVSGRLVVNVTHPEFMNLIFDVANNFNLGVGVWGSGEDYGSTAEEAYKNAFPLLISLKADQEITKDVSGVDVCYNEVQDDTAVLKVEYNTTADNDGVAFKWIIDKQCWMIIPDEHNTQTGFEFKTIESLKSYIKNMYDSLPKVE